MTTRTITGNIKSLTDSAVATGTVTFEKLVTRATGSTIHQSGVTTATTDGGGDFSIDLAVPASGSYRYRMILPNGASFYFSIASGASVNVATLIVAETIEDSDAIVEALAAYLPLSGGTLTGQLNFSGTTHAGIKLLSLTTAQRDALTPANGMVIYNTTTATGQVYQGGAWVSVGASGGAVDSVFGRTGAVVAADDDYALSQIADDSALAKSSAAAAVNTLATSVEGLETVTQAHYNATTSVHGIADTAALLTTGAIGSTVQAHSAKTAAIAALTWAANSIILLTGTTTASVQALAAHVVTFLQSASAADARTAIGAGTGNGDVTGPASSTDNAIARFDLATGKLLQNSTATLDDNGNLDIPGFSSQSSREIRLNSSTPDVRARLSVSSNVLNIVGVSGVSVATYSSNAEMTRVTATGLGIGTTAPQGRLHSYQTGGGFLHVYKSGVVGSATAVIPDAAGDVTLCLSGTFTISDGAGNTAGGVITKTAPGGTFNLYDDGGTNTCQLQISAGGAVTVIRTAGSRTYAVNLQLNWM